MGKLNLEQLSKNIEALLKVMTLASKLAILIGGICVSVYSLKIGHFPQGLTIGDGLLFMLIAASFGFIYVFFVVSLVSFGVTLSPLIKLFSRLYQWSYKYRSTPRPKQVYEFAKFKWIHLISTAFAVLLIFILGKRDVNAYWNLPLLSIGMYFFYSIYLSLGEKIKNLELSARAIVKADAEDLTATYKVENWRKAQMTILFMLLAMPLFFSGVAGLLLEVAMVQAHIRVEKSAVFVKEPYATLMPVELKAAAQPLANQYVKFENVAILFKGLGTITIVSFKKGNVDKQLEIPNDQLLLD